MNALAVIKEKLNGSHIVLAKLSIVLAIVVLVAFAANIWQRRYFSLPEPVIVQPTVAGEVPPAVAAGLDKYDILLLGLDSREEEPGLGDRTDTMLLVTIDPDENYASVLTIPRDTRVRYEGKWRKINEVYSLDGAEGSVRAVEELLHMHVDRYAVVDFQSVIELVDLMGGVVVDVPVRMYTPLENIDLQKGEGQHLNGYDALAYMRYRDAWLDDMARSERQKEVLLQLADKILQPSVILKLPTIANTALTYMKTNISLQEIITLAKYGRTILSKGVENQVLPGVNDYYLGGWYFVPFLEEWGFPVGEAELEYRAVLEQRAIEEAEEAAAAEAAAAEADETEGEDGEDADGPGEGDVAEDGANGAVGDGASEDGAGADGLADGDGDVGAGPGVDGGDVAVPLGAMDADAAANAEAEAAEGDDPDGNVDDDEADLGDAPSPDEGKAEAA